MIMRRISLVEQKRLQWAKEREEMARLNAPHWETTKNFNATRNTTIRTRLSSRETTTSHRKPLRTNGHYASTSSLRSLEPTTTSLQSLDFSAAGAAHGGSMINIIERTEMQEAARKRSPSLPPIYTKDHQHQQIEHPGLEVEGSHYTNYPRAQKHPHRESDRKILAEFNRYEEREGETSGYASDSIEPHKVIRMADNKKLLPLDKTAVSNEMSDRLWQNGYAEVSDTSLPPSRRLSELNRARWGSLWYQDNHHNADPPPPSWLERGLSRLDHTSQILVINHESASSPDSSTTGSTASDSKTYLRGQNLPVDERILQEREAKRQKALELQNAIKQQLEEKDRKRKEERERKLREELEEEERIKRERSKEKERFEEEQKKLKEKEEAKLKKDVAMREILETAERIAREEKRQKRQRSDSSNEADGKVTLLEHKECQNIKENVVFSEENKHNLSSGNINLLHNENQVENFEKISDDIRKENHACLPVNKEVAIVLTGRLEENADFTSGSNLQFVNLIVNPCPREKANPVELTSNGLMKNLTSSNMAQKCIGNSPRIIHNRLLTPTKYRTSSSGRDCGTQTDGESEQKEQGEQGEEEITKEGKEVVNGNKRDIDKSTNTGSIEEKNSRSKSQPRTTLDSRPRWNANRPGTRYRTQSEKDPHYQKKLRLRRRRIESSDDRSRSPSPDRRKTMNNKGKVRNLNRRTVKLENYDADLSMDSLNSVIPLGIDDQSKVNIYRENRSISSDNKLDTWHNDDILSQLEALKNGLLLKQQEWKNERSLVSPNTDFSV